MSDIFQFASFCYKFCFIKLEAPPTIGLTHKLEGKWEVPRHLLRFTRKLGEGNYGQVHEALFSEVLKVAVKTLKKSRKLFLDTLIYHAL